MKRKLFFTLTALFTLVVFNSCQDDENIVTGSSEETLSNDSELTVMLTDMTAGENTVNADCIAINYPITVYGYNSSFQIENTYVITNNTELNILLSNFSGNEYYAVDYPITLTLYNQEQITVNNNNQLFSAIGNALQSCQPVNGCDNPAVLTDGLIIYMPFSNSFNDLKGANVTFSSSITFTADRNGNENCAVSFQGNQEFLHIASTSVNPLVDGDKFAVSFWFRMQNTEIADLERIFGKGNSNEGFSIGVYDMNTPMSYNGTYSIWDNEWNMDSSLHDDTDNWHHLVVTLDDEDGMLKLYRDGQLRNSIDFTGASIGAEPMDYFLGQWFKGYLDDLRVYKRSLSGTEVQTLYNLEGDCHTCLE